MSYFILTVVLTTLLSSIVVAQYDPNYVSGHDTMVHLMDWKYSDIADECERFLGPKGFGGVQLSPVAEHKVVKDRPWWERYQPISYKVHTRSGTEQDFLDMSRRCNKAGIRLYPDVILNHMSATGDTPILVGTAGSTCNPEERDYPAVPYSINDFNNPRCIINDWNSVEIQRNCNLVGLEDLNQTVPWTREKLIDHLNHLIDLGVAGFRIDAAKHMWPKDLEVIYGSLKNLNTEFGFQEGTRPFIFQEVIDFGQETVQRWEYMHLGPVTDFIFSERISQCFRGHNSLSSLYNFGPEWGLLESKYSFCFVDNHDNQRDNNNILSYKRPWNYRMAQAFSLAHTHGHRRVMSSFDFSERDQGPPQDSNENIISPIINSDGSCGNGWVCEHRWKPIYNMVNFKNVVSGTVMENWWSNGNNQIAFSRGNKGFIVFNLEDYDLQQTLQTGLPSGRYCDVISGERNGNSCTGIEINVNHDGTALFKVLKQAEDGMIAIHVGSNSRLDG